ncbi:MAG: nitrite/sulfite reductase [Acidobacteria bacterium]|nr:nitrite/sulfite reductase [Acidobacteriota bacterium]
MAAIDDPKTLGRARLSFAKESDIDEFVDMLAKFESGEIAPDQWRSFRLLRGTYGQRQTEDAQMQRIKIPQGILTVEQMEALADACEKYSRGFGHITTRQNIQLHFVKLHEADEVMRRVAQAGITTREACGNSVRNITACAYAGISATEPFDVTPYSEMMTRYFLRHRLSSSLPRKFKIGFEGCAEDHVKAAINDVAWLGRTENGRRGFRVLVGGGTATMPVSGRVLYEFLPAEEMLNVAEAVLRVFHALGDYKHKLRNRMKFLMKSLGWDRWHAEFEAALAQVLAEGGVPLPFDPARGPEEQPPAHRAAPPSIESIAARVRSGEVRGPGITPEPEPALRTTDVEFSRWAATNVRRQKQAGYVAVVATIPLGDLTGNQFRVLADLAQAYSDGTVRVTPTQNLVFRWVREQDARALYDRLAAAGLGLGDADTIADVVSCPGAESCKLAVTQSRGLGKYLTDYIREHPSLIPLAPSLDVKISGCPNGCGQHHIAAVGFQGGLRKLDGRAAPQYFVMIGGGVDAMGATFGRIAAKVPARRGAEALERLARLYADERRDDETAAAYFNRVDLATVKKRLADLEILTKENATPDDFIDLADTTEFAPETMEGECAS